MAVAITEFYSIVYCCLEDWNVIVDLGAVFLGHTLTDPDNVPAFLLLQLEIRVEHSEVELLKEGEHIQVHLEGTYLKLLKIKANTIYTL